MIDRVRDSNGNYTLRLYLADFPAFDLGDERVVIAVAGEATGLLLGAAMGGIVMGGRVQVLRRGLISAQKEMESTRAIAQNDVMAAKQFGNTSVFKDLLSTCDNLDRALAASEKDVSTPANSSLREGIALSRKEMYKTMEKHGVVRIPVTVGSTFTPDLCDAMMTQPITASTEIEENIGDYDGVEKAEKGKRVAPVAGTISQIFLPGYTIHERVLRPAQVSVYRNDCLSDIKTPEKNS